MDWDNKIIMEKKLTQYNCIKSTIYRQELCESIVISGRTDKI